jgi:hypothetical protein
VTVAYSAASRRLSLTLLPATFFFLKSTRVDSDFAEIGMSASRSDRAARDVHAAMLVSPSYPGLT